MGVSSSRPKGCLPARVTSNKSIAGLERRNEHQRWVRLQTSGQGPSPRSGHDVAVIGNKVYLFGGCGGEADAINCLNDMYCFDLDLHRWDVVHNRGEVEPAARASFGMCHGPIPGTLIVAGGTGVEMDSLRSDVMEFDQRDRSWRKLTGDGDGQDAPSKFYGQTVCTYKDRLLLFGGSTGLHYTNDLYDYNTHTGIWRKLTTTGKKPSPRYKHQSVVVGDKMYVIGGGCFKPEHSLIDMYALDLNTLEWEEPKAVGDVPKARVAHSCVYDPVDENIYLWGGFTGELSRLQDFSCYNTRTNTWHEIKSRPGDAVPAARAFHSAVFYDGALYVFSGANGDVRYNDIWRFQARSKPPSLAVLAARSLRESNRGMQCMMELESCVPRELWLGVLHMNEYARKIC
jgi:N-acetylneuraminic acid mutarotase